MVVQHRRSYDRSCSGALAVRPPCRNPETLLQQHFSFVGSLTRTFTSDVCSCSVRRRFPPDFVILLSRRNTGQGSEGTREATSHELSLFLYSDG